jgi:Transposase DDE domain
MSIASKKSYLKKRNNVASKSRATNSAKNKARKRQSKNTVSEKKRRLRPLKIQRRRIVQNERRLKKEQENIDRLSKNIQTFFGEGIIEQIAKTSGFLIRTAKILPYAFLIAVSFGTFGYGGKSQTGIATSLSIWFKIKVSAQAVSARLKEKKTVFFFKQILKKALSLQLQLACKNDYANLFKPFRGVKMEDSSKIELNEHVKGKYKGSGGGASKSALKVNYCFDITNNSATHVDVVSGIRPDQALAGDIVKKMKKGELIIRDLGYFSLDALLNLIKKGIFFLSRASKQTYFYLNQDDENPINLNEFLTKELENDPYIDCELYVGKVVRMKTRFIAEKVPEEVKIQRTKRYKGERKKIAPEDYVIWSGFSVFITNIPSEIWSPKIIILTYKIRWQIELFFKSIKSTLKIHVVEGEKENVVSCMIYAKLISILVVLPVISYVASICEEEEELSVDKSIKWLHEDNRFGNAIAKGTLQQMINDLLSDFHAICKDKRKKEQSTYQNIKNVIEEELKQTAA